MDEVLGPVVGSWMRAGHALLSINYVPIAPFEQELSSKLGISPSQVRFAAGFFASVLFGLGIRLFRNPTGTYTSHALHAPLQLPCRSSP